jgi:branched-chain amino acid transport system substrate-binding protein
MNSFSFAPLGLFADNSKKATDLWAEYFNKAGGVNGHPIELVYYDDRGDAAAAVTGFTKLTKEDKVVAIIGPMTSRPCEALEPYLTGNGPLVVSCTPAAAIKGGGYLYTSMASNEEGAAIVADILNGWGLKKIGLATDTTSSGDQSLAGMKPEADKLGQQLFVERFTPADVDFTSVLAKLKAAGIQGMMVWTTGAQSVAVVKQAQQLGMNMPIILSWGSHSYHLLKMLKDINLDKFYMLGFSGCTTQLPDNSPQRPYADWANKAFDTRYPTEKLEPTFSMLNMDVLAMLTSNMQAVGTDPAKMKEWMDTKVKGMIGLANLYTYTPTSHNRNAETNLALLLKVKSDLSDLILQPESQFAGKSRVKSTMSAWDLIIKQKIQ